MLLLAGSTDKIRLITSNACTIHCVASFMDASAAGPPVVDGSTSGTTPTIISTATTTDIVAAPIGSVRRNVKYINIRNAHATTITDVTVYLDRSATIYELHKVTLKPGDMLEFFEGVGWYYTPALASSTLIKLLTADDAGGQNVATVQPLFPTAGAANLAVGTYKMEGLVTISRAAGTTAHNTSTQFGGTATVSAITYQVKAEVGDVDTLLPVSRVIARSTAAAIVKASATVAATEQLSLDIDGIVRISVAGTLIPQFIYSVAPGGAPTIKAQSYMIFTPLGDNAFAQQGTWT